VALQHLDVQWIWFPGAGGFVPLVFFLTKRGLGFVWGWLFSVIPYKFPDTGTSILKYLEIFK
jgi:hypothetical protein